LPRWLIPAVCFLAFLLWGGLVLLGRLTHRDGSTASEVSPAGPKAEPAANQPQPQAAAVYQGKTAAEWGGQFNDPASYLFPRMAAGKALAAMGKPGVPYLVEGLRRGYNPDHRRQAAAFLAVIGADAASALPDLRRATQDEDAFVSEAAVTAIRRIER